MSIKKLSLSLMTVAVLTLAGAQGSSAANVNSDGKITAEEVRGLILDVGAVAGAAKKMDPKVATIDLTGVHINSASCEKGTDWFRFFARPGKSGGMLCNGENRWRVVGKWGPPYFNGPMQGILDSIVAEANLDSLGPGKVKSIRSNGKLATLKFNVTKNGKYTGLNKVLTVKGSEVTITPAQ